jgi:hypothetical protein
MVRKNHALVGFAEYSVPDQYTDDCTLLNNE